MLICVGVIWSQLNFVISPRYDYEEVEAERKQNDEGVGGPDFWSLLRGNSFQWVTKFTPWKKLITLSTQRSDWMEAFKKSGRNRCMCVRGESPWSLVSEISRREKKKFSWSFVFAALFSEVTFCRVTYDLHRYLWVTWFITLILRSAPMPSFWDAESRLQKDFYILRNSM